MIDTIFALSSGRPPAAIAVVRVSGPNARAAGEALAGTLPPPRIAGLRRLQDVDGGTLDQALTLFFPGPATVTGEDLLELHLHGGRAVVAAVEAALASQVGLRRAEPGEFTRRALINGRLDLAQAEGLADLLEAETDMQRRAALAMAEGGMSRTITDWLDRLSMAAARVEAELDFGDEDEVTQATGLDLPPLLAPVILEMAAMLTRPPVERLRDGVMVVLAGPRNAGKSSLFNALLGRPAAIVTDIAGTTRDVLEAGVIRAGLPYRLVDTAGLTNQTADPIEAVGITRAKAQLDVADLILWLGEPDAAPANALKIGARGDELEHDHVSVDHVTSVHDQASIDALWAIISQRSQQLIGDLTGGALHARHRSLLSEALSALQAVDGHDLLLDAEHLRIANRTLAAILGRDATEAMLDALFGRFCLGK